MPQCPPAPEHCPARLGLTRAPPHPNQPGAPGLLRGHREGRRWHGQQPHLPRSGLSIRHSSCPAPGLSPRPEEARQPRRAKGRGVTRTKCLEGCLLLRPLSNCSSRRSPGLCIAAHTGTGLPYRDRAAPPQGPGEGFRHGKQAWVLKPRAAHPRPESSDPDPPRSLGALPAPGRALGTREPPPPGGRVPAPLRRRSRRRDQNRKPGQTDGRAGQDEPELGMGPDGAPAGCPPSPAAPGRARSGHPRGCSGTSRARSGAAGAAGPDPCSALAQGAGRGWRRAGTCPPRPAPLPVLIPTRHRAGAADPHGPTGAAPHPGRGAAPPTRLRGAAPFCGTAALPRPPLTT